jgi:hypothetical protein
MKKYFISLRFIIGNRGTIALRLYNTIKTE